MLSAVSNVPSAGACKTSSDLMISSWNLLMEPDILVQPCRGNVTVDSRKTQGKAIADFRVESTSGSEALLASAENSKAGSNVGRQTALTVTCSSDRLDTEQGKYDTGDKIPRQTRLSKSKKPKAINSVAPPREDQICNTDLNVKGDLARHTKTKTRGTKHSFKCDICDREFVNASNLRRHARSHADERPSFQCDMCKREFVSADNLKRHARSHTGECPFRCSVCSCTFSRADYLRTHTRLHTGNKRLFECTICNKNFTRRINLHTHIDIHNNNPRFRCDTCDARFYKRALFKNHMRTHDGKRPYKCDICGSTFKTNSNLWTHKLIHTNKRTFKCDICDAEFKTKHPLSKHKKTHSKQPSYKTNKKSSKISSKRFTNDKKPDQLEPGHNNEKSFKSSHRNASFTSTATSNQHIKPKNHTTNSKTGLTNPGDVSTTSQLPSVSNQLPTSDIHVNKSQKQGKYGEYSEYAETVALLNEFADTYPITLEPGSFEHHDDLFLDQEMPGETFPDRQNANVDCLITPLHPVVDWPSTSSIHVDKSQDQEKCEETAEVLDYDYLQTIPPPQPSWDSGCPSGNFINDDFLCQDL